MDVNDSLPQEAWIAIIVVLVVGLLLLVILVVYCLYKQRSDKPKIVYQPSTNTKQWIETQSNRTAPRPQIVTAPSEVPQSQALVPVSRRTQLERLPIDAEISKTTYSNNTNEYGVVIKDIAKKTGQKPTQNMQFVVPEEATIYRSFRGNKQILNQMPQQSMTQQPMVIQQQQQPMVIQQQQQPMVIQQQQQQPVMIQQQNREILLQPKSTIVQALPIQGSNQYQQPVIKMPAQQSVEPIHYQGATTPQGTSYRAMTVTKKAVQYQPAPVVLSNQVSNQQPQPQSNYQPVNVNGATRYLDPRMTARIHHNNGPVSTIQVLQRQ